MKNIKLICLIIVLLNFAFIENFAQGKNSSSNESNFNVTENSPEEINYSTLGTFDFRGSVFMGENPLSKGSIFLFEESKGDYRYYSDNKVENGIFEFKEMQGGNYIIYVIPEIEYDFFYYPKYLPTYSGNVFNWDLSPVETIGSKTNEINIYLNSYSEPFFGHQKISGNIEYDHSYMGPPEVPIVVLLLNDKKQPMDFRTVDEYESRFTFDYLPEGTYYIHPEIAGIKSIDYLVNLYNNESDINFSIRDEIITIDEDEFEPIVESQGDIIKLHFDKFDETDNVVCELINLAGISVSKDIYSSDDVAISTSNLAAGIYIVKVSSYDHGHIKTKKVYINNHD
jgi:hypothetical protein